jgi:hypothetical protein
MTIIDKEMSAGVEPLPENWEMGGKETIYNLLFMATKVFALNM